MQRKVLSRFFFAVHKSVIYTIKEFKIINYRMAILIVEVKWFNIIFLNVYAPTKEKTREEKDEFYDF